MLMHRNIFFLCLSFSPFVAPCPTSSPLLLLSLSDTIISKLAGYLLLYMNQETLKHFKIKHGRKAQKEKGKAAQNCNPLCFHWCFLLQTREQPVPDHHTSTLPPLSTGQKYLLSYMEWELHYLIYLNSMSKLEIYLNVTNSLNFRKSYF